MERTAHFDVAYFEIIRPGESSPGFSSVFAPSLEIRLFDRLPVPGGLYGYWISGFL